MDFFGIGGWEFLVLILLAMFIFGPDKLPKAISDGVRILRNLRDMARNATTDLSRELGTDISLEDLQSEVADPQAHPERRGRAGRSGSRSRRFTRMSAKTSPVFAASCSESRATSTSGTSRCSANGTDRRSLRAGGAAERAPTHTFDVDAT